MRSDRIKKVDFPNRPADNNTRPAGVLCTTRAYESECIKLINN